jgi:Tfp pilus assembly protein PilV
MNPDKPTRSRISAYTLIEALVASSVLVIGIGAAASMSLAFVTQEEISERASKAFSHLDNAVALYQAGVPNSRISALLPPEPVVTSLTFTDRTIQATNLGAIPSTLITVTWTANGSTASSGVSRWTGGVQSTTRSASVEVVRTNPTLAAPLPRVDFFD